MTPSTSLTLQGFLQGLQPNLMLLISSVVSIVIVLFVARWYISRLLADQSIDDTDAATARKWVGSIVALVIVLTFVGFGMRAASFATNAIPHSDLDKSSIYKQMDSNIKR